MRLAPLALIALLPACAPSAGEVVDSQQLSLLLGVDDPVAIGLSVDPLDGTRYLLDANEGLYELDDGASLVLAADAFPNSEVPARSAWTDFAALGEERFALTAQTQGFLLDRNTNSLSLHFCYVPGFVEDEPSFDQITDSLTYDPAADLLYAQPQTFDASSGDVTNADVAMFDPNGGGDLAWFRLPDEDTRAGGLAVDADGDLLAAWGDSLYRVQIDRDAQDSATGDADFELVGSLSEAGITEASGMAFDPETGHLLVLDTGADLLVELALD